MTADDHGARLLLTIPELAAELRVDKRTVYRLLKAGELPLQVLRIGQSPRVRRVDVERYLAQLTERAEAESAERQRQMASLMWGRAKRRQRRR
jgi:excisionase family DNA binding protein